MRKIIIVGCVLITSTARASVIGEAGDLLQVMIPAYAAGMAINEKDWTGVKQFGYSFASMMATVQTTKALTHDTRPNGANRNAFPSGHTAAAFSGATFIHKRYGFERAIVPYVAASFVGFSRVYEKQHHTHDVLAGAAIGAGFSWLFADRIDRRVTLEADAHGAKINFTTQF